MTGHSGPHSMPGLALELAVAMAPVLPFRAARSAPSLDFWMVPTKDLQFGASAPTHQRRSLVPGKLPDLTRYGPSQSPPNLVWQSGPDLPSVQSAA